MKKTILLINFLITILACDAQISLEHRYTCNVNGCSTLHIGTFPFSDGKKYVYTDPTSSSQASTIFIQNSDHSNYKTISIPAIVASHSNVYNASLEIIYVTDNLFDLDAKTEYLCQLSYNFDASDSLNRYNSEVLILNEDGVILFRKDSASAINNFSVSYFSPIVKTETGTKLVLNNLGSYTLPNTSFEMNFSVYSLPGKLTVLRNPTESVKENDYLSTPFPNPSNEYCTVFYKLPANNTQGTIIISDVNGSIVKKIEVDSKNEYILFNNQNLNNGMYLYSLYANDNLLETKKLIVAH